MILSNEIPLFIHDSRVLLIDDNLSFLSTMNLAMSSYSNVDCYSNPMAAINDIRDNIKEGIDDESIYLQSEISEQSDRASFYVNYSNIVNDVIGKTKNKKISLIISDYSMPELNGVEFFSAIKESKAKKILLTGEADHNTAVQAFNDGLIDKFILKGVSSENDLKKVFMKLNSEYFINVSNKIDYSYIALRKSKEFVNIVNNWIEKNNIKSFCFYYESGSIVGRTAGGSLKWLLTMNEDQIKDILDIMSFSIIEETFKERVRSGQLLFCAPTQYSQNQEINERSQYFFESKGGFKVGKQNYFYSYCDNEIYNIHVNR